MSTFIIESAFDKSMEHNSVERWDCITRSQLPLQPHQINFIKEFDKVEHGLIAVHPPGSGKTLMAFAASQCYLDENSNNTVIIVSPASLKENFVNEGSRYGGIKYFEQYRFHTSKKFYNGYLKYQLGLANIEDIEDDDDIKEDEESKLNRELFSTKDALLILDEAHTYRTVIGKDKGRMAYAAIDAANKADKVIALTATPLVNSPYDLENLIAMVTPIPPSNLKNPKQFELMLTNRKLSRDHLGGKFNFHDIPESDLKYYPRKVSHNVYLRMPDDLYKSYLAQESYLDDLIPKTDEDIFKNDLSKFYVGIQMASNLESSEDVAKANFVVTLARDNPTHKIIVYSPFKTVGVDIVAKYLIKAGIPYGMITGSQSFGKKIEALSSYNNTNLQDNDNSCNDGIRILLITSAGATGLTTFYTDDIVHLNQSWNIAQEKQVDGRGIRFMSHKGRVDPVVNVWKLFMIKQDEYDYGADKVHQIDGRFNHKGQYKSIDLLLMDAAERKQKAIDSLYKTTRIYNSEISAVKDQVRKVGNAIVDQLNDTIFTVFDYYPYVGARGKIKEVADTVLVINTPNSGTNIGVTIRIPLFTISCRAAPVNKSERVDGVRIVGSMVSDNIYGAWIETSIPDFDQLSFNDLSMYIKSFLSYEDSPRINKQIIQSFLLSFMGYIDASSSAYINKYMPAVSAVMSTKSDTVDSNWLISRFGNVSIGNWKSSVHKRSEIILTARLGELRRFHLFHNGTLFTYELEESDPMEKLLNYAREISQNDNVSLEWERKPVSSNEVCANYYDDDIFRIII